MQDWLTAQAEVNPDKLALITNERQMTFDELRSEVRAGAAVMRSTLPGMVAGARIGILAESTAQTVIAMLALLRWDVVLIPLNTRLTAAEITFQVQQTNCAYLLYDDAFTDLAAAVDFEASRKITLHTALYEGTMRRRPAQVMLNAQLAIVHTSGTSGQPKGAVLTYGNVFYSAMSSAYRIGVQPDDRWLCVLPLYHVGGLSIILRSILYGTAVHLLPKFDVDTVNHALTHEPITLVSLVPTMLYRLLEKRQAPWNPKLRLVLLGGAAPSAELVQQCIAEDVPVATTYGLTEAASQVATALPEQVREKPGSVGKPLMFTRLKVINAEGHEAQPHDIGQIIVSGPTVMQGYDRNREATAQTLRGDWLYTGDMGYRDADGDLFIVQRRSDLIVSGGENVYPAEVENVLRQHPGVQDVAVIGVDDAEWGQRVAAAIVLRPGATLTADDIQTHARTLLAGYKVPRQVRFLDVLPRTASGKVQRGALRDMLADD